MLLNFRRHSVTKERRRDLDTCEGKRGVVIQKIEIYNLHRDGRTRIARINDDLMSKSC